MSETVFVSGLAVIFGVAILVMVKVEVAARRAERIYIARQRQHDKVPPMQWRSRDGQ